MGASKGAVMVIDITKIKSFGRLPPALKLLFTLLSIADERGCIRTNKDDLARAINVTRQTVGNHLIALCNSKVIKYKYSGLARLNPDFFRLGNETERANYRKDYDAFVSDI